MLLPVALCGWQKVVRVVVVTAFLSLRSVHYGVRLGFTGHCEAAHSLAKLFCKDQESKAKPH